MENLRYLVEKVKIESDNNGGFCFFDINNIDYLEAKKEGLIESILSIKIDNKVATRLTEKGERFFKRESFKIDEDIKIPKIRRFSNGAPEKYPFSKLEIGSSFHVPISKNIANKLASACSMAGKRHNKTFKLRTVDSHDKDGEGIRVFRIS